MGKKGGAMPGAGRPKGGMNASTKLRLKTEREMQTRIMGNVDQLINAQMSLAKGLSYLYKVYKKGGSTKSKLVTSAREIKKYLDGDYENSDFYYYITAQKPDSKAIDSMMDRAYGKPVQKTALTDTEGNDLPEAILDNIYGRVNSGPQKADRDTPKGK